MLITISILFAISLIAIVTLIMMHFKDKARIDALYDTIDDIRYRQQLSRACHDRDIYKRRYEHLQGYFLDDISNIEEMGRHEKD